MAKEKDITVNEANEVKAPLTEEQIIAKVKELKKQPTINSVFVLKYGDKVAFIKPPSRDQIKYATTVSQGNHITLAEEVFRAGWLDGDEEILNEDKYFLDVAAQIDTIIETEHVEIKKY